MPHASRVHSGNISEASVATLKFVTTDVKHEVMYTVVIKKRAVQPAMINAKDTNCTSET